jgi:hypothetical protein
VTKQRSVSRFGVLFVVALLAIPLAGLNSSFNPVTRICVVSVYDSSLFTLCPPSFRSALADKGLKNLPPPSSTWYDSRAKV